MMLCISVRGPAARGAAVWTALGITSNNVFLKKNSNFGLSQHLNFYNYLYYYILATPFSEMHCYTRQRNVDWRGQWVKCSSSQEVTKMIKMGLLIISWRTLENRESVCWSFNDNEICWCVREEGIYCTLYMCHSLVGSLHNSTSR